MPKGPKGRPPEGTPTGIDAILARPKRKRLNALERRERKAAAVQELVKKIGRQAQKGKEPNDRRHNRDVEREVAQMKPVEFYELTHDSEDDDAPRS